MSSREQRAPLPVYMLADHLDAVLAAGEDLVSCGARWRALYETPGNVETFPQRQRDIAQDVRSLELIVIARVLKSRDHARALAQVEKGFAPIADLFVSGTALLLDAVGECGDATSDDFETADGLVAYVRARGLISPEAAGIRLGSDVGIDESFLIAKRLALGPLMDMAAAFLDALDAHYELFIDVEVEEELPRNSRSKNPTSAPPRSEFGRRERSPAN